nr:MAG TPA: hypothetical protein [Bacteriophage sp.]
MIYHDRSIPKFLSLILLVDLPQLHQVLLLEDLHLHYPLLKIRIFPYFLCYPCRVILLQLRY